MSSGTLAVLEAYFKGKLFYCSTLLSSFAFTYFLYRKYFKTRHLTVVKEAPNCPLINEVLFFSEKYALCSNHDTSKSACNSDDCGLEKLRKIIAYLDSATTSLDLCVFSITSYQLATIVLKKFKEGVRVRIITDEANTEDNGSQIPLFRKKGVLVRARQSTTFLMHHKFAIVDKRLLLNGSFNWTATATFGNWENVHISNHPDTVQMYSSEFEKLWKSLL